MNSKRDIRGFLKSSSRVFGVIIFSSLMLGRCAFEGGALSKQVITIPDEVVLSSLTNGNEGNELVDEYTMNAIEQIQEACWQSGWRRMVRILLWTGPSSISVEVKDNLIGTRETTIDCSIF